MGQIYTQGRRIGRIRIGDYNAPSTQRPRKEEAQHQECGGDDDEEEKNLGYDV